MIFQCILSIIQTNVVWTCYQVSSDYVCWLGIRKSDNRYMIIVIWKNISNVTAVQWKTIEQQISYFSYRNY